MEVQPRSEEKESTMETATAIATQPQERQLVPQKEGFFRNLFGQLATKDFWQGMASLIVRETTYAFIRYLGGSLVHYVEKRSTPDASSVRSIANGGVAQPPQGSPAQAFSNASVPTPQYRPQYSPSQSGSTPPFPGFGQ